MHPRGRRPDLPVHEQLTTLAGIGEAVPVDFTRRLTHTSGAKASSLLPPS
jgi:hypothetical protein